MQASASSLREQKGESGKNIICERGSMGKSEMSYIRVMRMNPAIGTSGCNLFHSAATALAQHAATKSENEDTTTGPTS